MGVDRRVFLGKLGLAMAGTAAFGISPEEAEAYELLDSRSPKRRTRAKRRDTKYVVLHTTEANGTSSLNSLTRYGTANYMVDTNGKVYRIMNPDQIAIGSGRSMWKGKTNLDEY